ncbi:glycosyltransferase family 4 protein [Cohnella sp. REN36]|uniref:glycosyltransferase family 4 protein n=1 Tax=Cohnella sp. REN36 TaxID=2887347 RepID=UPI001D132913|nr:glycosyltransferase family 4 protein [Cohnella sp. REN36]MCC3377316.1 glycosyltransferase family 4 protein [Cohnella sp. REN36]
MIKAAFVTPGGYPVPSPRGGSVERVVEHFVPHLTGSVRARIYGRIGRGLSARGIHRGVPCERFPAADKSAYLKRVIRRLEAYRPDVIEVENRPLYARQLKRRFPQAQVWLHLHSNTFVAKSVIAPKTLRACVRAADRILVNSRYLEQDVLRRVPSAVGKIGIVYPGVEAERFIGQDGTEERRLRGWTGRRIVLYVGRLIPLKGVHHLLEALPDIVRAVPNTLLVIVGSASYGSNRETAYVRRLRRLAKPLRRHVHFEPYVSHIDIPRWFAMADAAVVPSTRREAFGLVNVEAMAAGLPVVATRVGGIAEIVADGETGFLVDPGNIRAGLSSSLVRLLQDEPLRRMMGKLGRERALRHFTWRQTAERWLRELGAGFGQEALPAPADGPGLFR